MLTVFVWSLGDQSQNPLFDTLQQTMGSMAQNAEGLQVCDVLSLVYTIMTLS